MCLGVRDPIHPGTQVARGPWGERLEDGADPVRGSPALRAQAMGGGLLGLGQGPWFLASPADCGPDRHSGEGSIPTRRSLRRRQRKAAGARQGGGATGTQWCQSSALPSANPTLLAASVGHCPGPWPAWLPLLPAVIVVLFLGRAFAPLCSPPTPHMWEPQASRAFSAELSRNPPRRSRTSERAYPS